MGKRGRPRKDMQIKKIYMLFPKKLIDDVDEIIKKEGHYSSRSEFIRMSVLKAINEIKKEE